MNFCLWRTGAVSLFWHTKAACEPPTALLYCWFYVDHVTAGCSMWESSTALGAGRQGWDPTLHPCSSSSLIFQLFVYCYREGQGWLSNHPTGELCWVFLTIKRGICSCLGFMRILGCNEKQPGWDTDKRNVFVKPPVTQKISACWERANAHPALLQAGARSTPETNRKEESFVLGRYLEIL